MRVIQEEVRNHYPSVLLTTPEECQEYIIKNSDYGGADRVLEVAGANDTFQLAWQCRPLSWLSLLSMKKLRTVYYKNQNAK